MEQSKEIQKLVTTSEEERVSLEGQEGERLSSDSVKKKVSYSQKKMDFSQEKSRKSQKKVKKIDFSLTFLD